jgi:hypothetical protein
VCSDAVGRAPAEIRQAESGRAVRAQAEFSKASFVMLRKIENRAAPGTAQSFTFVAGQGAQRSIGIPLKEALPRHPAMGCIHAFLSQYFLCGPDTAPPWGERGAAGDVPAAPHPAVALKRAGGEPEHGL